MKKEVSLEYTTKKIEKTRTWADKIQYPYTKAR